VICYVAQTSPELLGSSILLLQLPEQVRLQVNATTPSSDTLFWFGLVWFQWHWVWTQTLILVQVLLRHPFSPFGFNLEIVLLFALASLDSGLLFVLPCGAGMTGQCHQAQPLFEMGISWTFYLSWTQTAVLPISASQVARITGVSQCTWPW
jgi:hypothetical protein